MNCDNFVQVGPVRVGVHRTVRVSTEQTNNLPPSLGYFDVYKVSDFRETTPKYWEDNAVFLAMHDEEALWFSFNTPETVAMLVGAGGINALTGEELNLKLEKDNYLVTPPQPWLDGWKDTDGTVYQFVGTFYKKGDGKSVGEQILKEKSKTGGIGIAVFAAKNPEKIRSQFTPQEKWGFNHVKSMGGLELCSLSSHEDEKDYDMECCYSSDEVKTVRLNNCAQVSEMAVGKGGKIDQKIYPDPHGLEAWKTEPQAAVAIYLVNAEQFSKITGMPMPPIPKVYNEYFGKWFGLEDKHMKDVAGTDKFTGLATVFGEKARVVNE